MEKDLEQIKFDEELGKKLSKIIKKKDIPLKELAKKIGISRGNLDGYRYGTYGLSAYRIYKLINILNLSLSDIANFFNMALTETETEKPLTLLYSDNPEINEKISILKQIYESGDEILMGSVDMCLKGAYEDFLEKKRKKTG